MREIYLYGAGGHAKVIAEILELQGIVVKGIFDDNKSITAFLDYPALGSFHPERVGEYATIVISIGDNRIRQKIVGKLDVPYARALHPSALISKRASVGEGSVVMAGVTINSGAKIGRHVILNTQCSVDHDCQISDYVHISPQVALAGDVKVGEGTHIGIGAAVIQGVRIGKWCTIGAGSVIIRDVPDGATVVGNPGRIIKGA